VKLVLCAPATARVACLWRMPVHKLPAGVLTYFLFAASASLLYLFHSVRAGAAATHATSRLVHLLSLSCDDTDDTSFCAPPTRTRGLHFWPCAPPFTTDIALSAAAPPNVSVSATRLPLCPGALGEAAAVAPPGVAPLYGSPNTVWLRSAPFIAYDTAPCASDGATSVAGSTSPRHSVVVSAHNAEKSIALCLTSLLNTTVGVWELILVLDGCTDATFDVATATLRRAVQGGATGGLVRARVVVQGSPVWETSSDNVGLRLAHPNATALILVQADMELTERGWNARMEAPLAVFSDVWAVGGRDAHNAGTGRGEGQPQAFNLTPGRDLGHAPTAAELGSVAGLTLYIRDVVNRGPLLLRADITREAGFLNERDFLIRRDEHELMLRVWASKRLRCGKLAVGWRVPAADVSASRAAGRFKHRSSHEWVFNAYRRLRAHRKGRERVFEAAGRVAHWNEERHLTPGDVAHAKARAELEAGRVDACDGGKGQRCCG
jgi:hypothetical protein